MICPKCEEGTIERIRFKKNGDKAYLCEFCEALWFQQEDVTLNTGYTLRSYSDGTGLEYTIEDMDEKDQDHRSVRYSSNK